MKFLATGLTLFSAASWTVNALPAPEEAGTLAWRAWDLRFLSEAPPVCDPSESNLNYSIGHRYGQTARSCQETFLNMTEVKSISWKSPSETSSYDICMFGTDNCTAESFLSTITNQWDVCYLYNGFLGWSVVASGDPCIPDVGDGGDDGEQV